MNVLLCIAYCLPLVLTSIVADIPNDIVDNEDFVIVDTIEDYDGNIVPSVDDEFIEESVEDNVSDGVVDDSVVEQITVNQTVVDNTEVLEKMDKLDSKLTLLNNSFNSVITSSSSNIINSIYDDKGWYDALGSYLSYNTSKTSRRYVYDVSDYDIIYVDFDPFVAEYGVYYFSAFGFNIDSSEFNSSYLPNSNVYDGILAGRPITSRLVLDVSNYDYVCMSTYNTSNMGWIVSASSTIPPVNPDDPDDPSGNDPENPSINVTYPQEVIDNVNNIKNELVTLQYLTLLNITLPMIIACVKRITFPNRKEINK